MVTVKEVKKAENSMGEEFFGLIVQSGAVAVKSKETGRVYFTAKTAFVSTTFDEETATSMIGQEFEGILFHSALSPYINVGLITPEFIIQKILDFHKKNKIRMNSL